jgi:general secretion pathway protein D
MLPSGHRLVLRSEFIRALLGVSISILMLLPLHAVGQDNWKINLKNADIREFVTQVSAITGKSFIIDPRVKGDVTVISNTSMDTPAVYELFLAVLRVHGFAAVPSGNVVRIVQQVLAKQSSNPKDFTTNSDGEELITRVLTVKNTDSNELVKILRPLIPQYGHIAGLVEPNALIISDHAENILRLAEIVARIDVADNSTTRIIQLQEAWIEDIVSLLEQLAPEQMGKGAKGPNRITVVASERTNSLILKGEPDTLTRVEALVRELDVAANRSGTIQVVRLAHSDATDLAEILKNLVADKTKGEQSGNEITTSIQADAALNALVIRADPTTMAELKEIISHLDVRRLQVLIEAAIVEVTSDFTRAIGTELAVADTTGDLLPIGLTAPGGTLASVLADLAANNGTLTGVPNLRDQPLIGGAKVNVDGINFALIVRALSTNSDVDLLSTPSITTMDNETAKIVVGQNVPFRTGSTNAGNNGLNNPFTTIQREDVGLTLEVTPHVHDGSLIRLEIHQEVSSVAETNIGADGSADLITNKRSIDTTVLADDRQIIILGGLIRDNVTDTVSQVPLLGDIPILGRLFKSTTKKIEKQNLLVFLRPTVLASKEQVRDETLRKYTGIWEVEIEGRDATQALKDLFDAKR